MTQANILCLRRNFFHILPCPVNSCHLRKHIIQVTDVITCFSIGLIIGLYSKIVIMESFPNLNRKIDWIFGNFAMFMAADSDFDF